MSNLTASPKGQFTAMPNKNEATQSASKNQQIISIDAVEVQQPLNVSEIFLKVEQLKQMQIIYDRYIVRQKELNDYEAEAKEESGVPMRSSLKSGRCIEFMHTPSNLDFIREQIKKNAENIKEMEEKIKEFVARFSLPLN
jgi:hypothetical protein